MHRGCRFHFSAHQTYSLRETFVIGGTGLLRFTPGLIVPYAAATRNPAETRERNASSLQPTGA
jgi:hypothetical protein